MIECLAKGHSVEGFAGSIGVAKTNVYQWIKKHEDFAEAFEIAKAKSVFFWEGRLIDLSEGGKGNAASVIFGVANRAPDEWRNIQKVEHTGKDGGPIKQEVSAKDELDRRIASIAARKREAEASGRLN